MARPRVVFVLAGLAAALASGCARQPEPAAADPGGSGRQTGRPDEPLMASPNPTNPSDQGYTGGPLRTDEEGRFSLGPLGALRRDRPAQAFLQRDHLSIAQLPADARRVRDEGVRPCLCIRLNRIAGSGIVRNLVDEFDVARWSQSSCVTQRDACLCLLRIFITCELS